MPEFINSIGEQALTSFVCAGPFVVRRTKAFFEDIVPASGFIAGLTKERSHSVGIVAIAVAS